jgi:hypothetical protein
MIDEAEAAALKSEARRRERRDTLLRFLHLKRGAGNEVPSPKGD